LGEMVSRRSETAGSSRWQICLRTRRSQTRPRSGVILLIESVTQSATAKKAIEKSGFGPRARCPNGHTTGLHALRELGARVHCRLPAPARPPCRDRGRQPHGCRRGSRTLTGRRPEGLDGRRVHPSSVPISVWRAGPARTRMDSPEGPVGPGCHACRS
jgi:hypothetical protein